MKQRGRKQIHDRAWQTMLVVYVIAHKRRLRPGLSAMTDEAACHALIREGLYPGMKARSLRTRLAEARKAVTQKELQTVLRRLSVAPPDPADR